MEAIANRNNAERSERFATRNLATGTQRDISRALR